MGQLSVPLPSRARLPVLRRLAVFHACSVVIAVILAAASVVGLLYQDSIYPTAELKQSFVANDVVNLLVGLPVLLGAMWLTRRGRLVGLLFWPGALFFIFYNAVAYVFALPPNPLFVLNLLLLPASAYTMAALLASIDGKEVQRRLSGVVPERICGGALLVMGVLFALFAAVMMAGALTDQTSVSVPKIAVNVADVTIIPALIVAGALLWRRAPFGYVAAVGLLYQTSMLFVGLIAVLILQPVLTTATLALVDILVLCVMGLFCFIPLGLAVRNVVAGERRTAARNVLK